VKSGGGEDVSVAHSHIVAEFVDAECGTRISFIVLRIVCIASLAVKEFLYPRKLRSRTSLRIYVDAYSGYRANERPRQFCLDDDVFEIAEVEDRWYDLNAEYFDFRTTEGKRYILRHDERANQWNLQGGFDGAELPALPGSEIVTVDPSLSRLAESKIPKCERRRAGEPDHPFGAILADVQGKQGMHNLQSIDPSMPNTISWSLKGC
jgi:hypothetical protein